MDLLKEEVKLIEKKHKALENVKKKERYLAGATTSFRKAQRELKIANRNLHIIRKRIKGEGIERPAVEPVDPVEVPEVIPETANWPKPVEENTD